MKVRKFTNLVAILIIIFCVSVIVVDKLNNKEKPSTLFYSLDQTRYLNDESDYRIRLYTYKDINVDYANFYFKDNNNLIKIDVLNLENLGSTIYNDYMYNIYDISVLNKDKFKYNEIVIEYDKEQYLLEINTNKLNVNKSNLLDYNYINGHFSYINNNLILVGITINLNEDIIINRVSINDNIYVINNLIEEKKIESNIIDNVHDYTKINFDNYKLSKNKYYYLPLSYKKIEIVISNKIKINDKAILILDFLNSPRELKDFPSFINKGILYVRD